MDWIGLDWIGISHIALLDKLVKSANLLLQLKKTSLQTTTASMLAGGTNLACTGRTSAGIECKINKDLDNIRRGIISNKLTLNTKKTEFVIIKSKPR